MALITDYVRTSPCEARMSARVEEAVFVEAPARLHFGVLDLRGAMGRWFGGIGAAAPAPTLLVSASHADTLTVEGEDVRPCRRVRAAAAVARGGKPRRALGARVRVHRALPAHVGAGIRHAAGAGNRAGACRPARRRRRRAGAGARDGARQAIRDRHVDVRRRRAWSSRGDVAWARTSRRRCWRGCRFRPRGGAWSPCHTRGPA